MKINYTTDVPIFIQIAQQLEDSIFTGVFPPESKIPSTTEIAILLNINPHTVLKGISLLVDEEILYKKRGIGMFVKEGAPTLIKRKRQKMFDSQYIQPLFEEADKLQLTKDDLLQLIERGYEKNGNSN